MTAPRLITRDEERTVLIIFGQAFPKQRYAMVCNLVHNILRLTNEMAEAHRAGRSAAALAHQRDIGNLCRPWGIPVGLRPSDGAVILDIGSHRLALLHGVEVDPPAE